MQTGLTTAAAAEEAAPAAPNLLHFEHVLVEVLLQLLVGQVDAELLKVVLLELLKACGGCGDGKLHQSRATEQIGL